MGVRIIDSAETYRLVCDDTGCRWAVVEARCRHVYSLDPHHSRSAPDCAEGIEQVIGPNGWRDESTARREFADAVDGERYYSQVIW
ncbi:MAG: hypothetical protein ACM31L_04025 [Actinomycetota bacterium]